MNHRKVLAGTIGAALLALTIGVLGPAVLAEFEQLPPRNNWIGTTAPAVTDDSGDGYSAGSVWVDATGSAVYTCTDASAGAANWEKLNIGAGDVELADMADLAADTVIGRANGAGTGVPTALSVAQVETILSVATASAADVIPKADGAGNLDIAFVADATVTLAKLANVATATMMGRLTAGTGVPEALTVANVETLLSVATASAADVIPKADGAGNLDIAFVADGAVTLAKLADLAQDTIIGRVSGAGTGVPQALTAAQVYAIISGEIPSADSEQLHISVRKGSAGTIAAGSAVYVSGWNGGLGVVEVELAEADVSASMPAIGVTYDPITNAATMDLPVTGVLTGDATNNIDTTFGAVGDGVWVSATAGAMVNAAPAGEHRDVQRLGLILRAHATLGAILLVGAGRINATPNLVENKIFVGDSSSEPVTSYVPVVHTFLPADFQLPTANPAALITRNDWEVLAFDGGTDEHAYIVWKPPLNLGQGSWYVKYVWASATEVGGETVIWTHEADKVTPESSDIDTAWALVGSTYTTTDTCTVAAGTLHVAKSAARSASNWQAGANRGTDEIARIRIGRDATADSSTGDAHLLMVELYAIIPSP